MVVHLARQVALGYSWHGGYRGAEVEVGIEAKKVAEDTQGRTHEKIAALLFDELAYLLSPTFKMFHNSSEEIEIAGVIGNKRA